jgi:hypothetical protein
MGSALLSPALFFLVACATGEVTDGQASLDEGDSATGLVGSTADAATGDDTSSPAPAGPLSDSGSRRGALDSGSRRVDGGSPGSDSGSSHIDAAGAVPATCGEVNGKVGCCGPDGNAYYCATASSTVKSTSCTGGKVCGWNASRMYYSCVSPPSHADPSGVYPITCP